MKAHVYCLGGTVGVCELVDDSGAVYVAECVIEDGVKVLPQSVRRVENEFTIPLEVDGEASAQDHVDRSALGLERFRQRLETFDADWVNDAEMSRWTEQAIAARDDLVGLIGKLRAEKGVGW